MWLLDRKVDVLRIGRQSVERWIDVPGGLHLQGRYTLGGAGVLVGSDLREAVESLFATETAAKNSRGRAHVVLESCWLPVMLLPLGDGLWSRRQVESLMRHRVEDLYGGAEIRDIEVRYRAGDSSALGYALPASVRAAVQDSLGHAMVSATSLQPACVWGWQRFATERRSMREGWWVWLEQDRSLVAWTNRGRWRTLNAGAPALRTAEELARCLASEGVRSGVRDGSSVCLAAGWGVALPSSVTEHCQVSWLTVAAPQASKPTSSVPTAPGVPGAA